MRLGPRLALVLVLTLGTGVPLAGCGDDGTSTWSGPSTPLPAGGTLPLDGFNAYLDSVDEAWERWAVGIATAYALPAARDTTDLHTEFQTSDPDGSVIVSVTIALLDDSVRDLRFVLGFDPLRGGAYRLLDAVWQQRCHVGRGHQGWSRALCV